MRHNPKPQEMYRHFKGDLYQIRCLAKHSETGEMLVVYQAMYGTFEIYARPLSMFMEEVDRVKYPSAVQRYRFELLETMEDDEDTVARPDSLVKEKPEKSEKAEEPEKPKKPEELEEPEEQLNIDPLVLEFLDADSYGQRLSILDSLHNRITDDMINMMAVSADLEIKEGEVEDRYMELRNCLRTFEKYECNRLR
ncbi:MAG: DUF1653 domain-containing protein [Lachnospiraceae bacterium]|nr:DUF1653 domain-containing protein [Lachnospiraceae bacterium]